MTEIIQVVNLTKTHHDQKIVDGISLSVEEGDIFGLVGPNGAGKTAMIRMMTTLLMPSQGDILIDGHSVRSSPEMVRRRIGYLPESCGYYSDMTAWEYLDFFGACYKIPKGERSKLTMALLELVDLSDRMSHQVKALSHGMKKKLNMARALLHDPGVLIMDNPLSGLDPYARVEFYDLLSELAQMGKTIFFSTQILEDITKMCKHVGILEAGKLVALGSVQELRNRLTSARTIQIKIQGQAESVHSLLKNNPYISDMHFEDARPEEPYATFQIQFQGDEERVVELLTVLIKVGVKVFSFQVDSNAMEDLFLYTTRGVDS